MMPAEIIRKLRESCTCKQGELDPLCLFCEARLQIGSQQLTMKFLHERLAEVKRSPERRNAKP